ncbi:MAG: hypothetical protein COV99_08580 [Bacteroidetes bacterium CG12_big_fil_rev_8_21_14_0_65_60_17]|nr:MAG: hypothetical protein COV99_08580 [Bacteroidetes bacterium CG12_big_fil_rev_8_21_14_0_65_60_17]
MYRSAIATCFLLLMAGHAAAQQPYVLSDSSRLAIHGTSTVNSFECEAAFVTGSGVLDGGSRSSAHVEVRVPDLDCGKRRMNRDLKEALRSDEFPLISFNLQYAERVDSLNTIQIVGTLSLAGASRDINVLLHAERRTDGSVRGWGRKHLRMTDFDVDPPTALFGVVKAHDDIEIVFNLIANPGAPSRDDDGSRARFR